MFAMLKPRDVWPPSGQPVRYQAESGLIYAVHRVERDRARNRLTLLVTTPHQVGAFSWPLDSPDPDVRLDH